MDPRWLTSTRPWLGADAMAWGFHCDGDVAPDVVRRDLEHFPTRVGATCRPGDQPPFLRRSPCGASRRVGRCPRRRRCGAPSSLAWVSATCWSTRGEPRAYESSRSVDLYICPRMGHMHNFAGTRELFWRRIETWARWVRGGTGLMDFDHAEDLPSSVDPRAGRP